MRLSVCVAKHVCTHACMSARARANLGGRERENFSINIYARQTDQWLLKRSRADDDGYRLYVLTKSDGDNDYKRVRARTCTDTHARTVGAK